MISRRRFLESGLALAVGGAAIARGSFAHAGKRDPKVDAAVAKALEFLAREQKRQGYWEANGGRYRAAMTALAGTALLAEGSTTTRGKYAPNIVLAADFLLDTSQEGSGLIGYPDDYHYTYGHGFSMLFLSQVFGEEEDPQHRLRIKKVLEKAVRFSAEAQTTRGGWGYVSAREGQDFDEGSTCITQVQGLRPAATPGLSCRGKLSTGPRSTSPNARPPKGACSTASAAAELVHRLRPPLSRPCSMPANTRETTLRS